MLSLQAQGDVPVLGLVLVGESGAIGTLAKSFNLLLLLSTKVLTQSQ